MFRNLFRKFPGILPLLEQPRFCSSYQKKRWGGSVDHDSEDGCERICEVCAEEWDSGREERNSRISEKPAQAGGQEDSGCSKH